VGGRRIGRGRSWTGREILLGPISYHVQEACLNVAIFEKKIEKFAQK